MGLIVYLAALKKGAIRAAHSYFVIYIGRHQKYSKSCSPVLMADKDNYFTFKNKIFISYTKTIQTKTVDKLVDKILLYYNHEKNSQNSKGKRYGMSLCGIYGIYPEFASIS